MALLLVLCNSDVACTLLFSGYENARAQLFPTAGRPAL